MQHVQDRVMVEAVGDRACACACSGAGVHMLAHVCVQSVWEG